MLVTPIGMEFGMVVLRVVCDDDHALAGDSASPFELAEEGPAGVPIEASYFSAG